MTSVKSYSEMRREFYDKYQKTIVPLVKKYDDERKKKLIIAIISAIACCLIGSFFLYNAFISEPSSDAQEGAFKVSLFFFLLAGAVWYMIKKGFENKIKTKIMPTVCSCFGKLKWTEGFYSYDDLFQKSCVVSQFTGSDYDDIFNGVHKDVPFEIIEAEYSIGSGKNRRTVFDGVIIKLKMNKEFLSHTVITPNSMFHVSPLKELRHTTLEDVEFEKKFDVYTNDEVDARYLITPTFMERLKAMRTAFKADKVQCAFFGDLLLVALSTSKDLFSLCSLVKPLDDAQQYFQMYEEIVSIIKLIDHFKLDQKIGL